MTTNIKNKKAVNKVEVNKLAVYDMQGKKIEDVDTIFDGKVNKALLSQVVKMYLANKRCGLASTKTIGEVSGGGKKPWKQKGTGRARAGSIRSPLWRHGGVVFGPHPRDYRYSLPARARNLALLSALSEKAGQEKITVLESLHLANGRTKEIKALLDNLKIKEKAILVMAEFKKDVQQASGNFKALTLALAREVNALDILNAKAVILLKDALEILQQRCTFKSEKLKANNKIKNDDK